MPNKIIDTLDITSLNKDELCAMKAKMLIFKRKKICKQLLNLKINKKEIKKLKKNIKVKKICGRRSGKYNLEGFYIEPVDPDLGVNDNNIAFRPLWSYFQAPNKMSHVSLPNQIIVEHHAITINQNVPTGCPGDILAQTVNSTNQQFNHFDFQFSSYFPTFQRSYISYYDLFMIANYAKYVGIAGSRVTSGNLVAVNTESDSHSGVLSLEGCDTQYFTYRFVGFDLVDKIACTKKKNIIALRRTDNDPTKNGVEIPAESWAVPCPPRWVPD